jgi:hypothetical protein
MLHLQAPRSSQIFLGLMALGMTGCRGCQSDVNLVDQDPKEEEIPAFTNDFGQWLSMGAMSDGSPAITYYDATDGGVGFAIATIGDDGAVTWAREEVDGYVGENGLDSGDRGKYTSMAVAADDTVWVTYQDVGLGTMRYARRDPQTGTWTSDVADIGGGSSSDAGYFTSLALDSSGNPVAVHYDRKQGSLRPRRRRRGHRRERGRVCPARHLGGHRVCRLLRPGLGGSAADLGHPRQPQHRDHRQPRRRGAVARSGHRRWLDLRLLPRHHQPRSAAGTGRAGALDA